LAFHWKLAWQLINNPWVCQTEEILGETGTALWSISLSLLCTKPENGWAQVSFVMQNRYTSSIFAQGSAENASETIAHATHLSDCALAVSQIMSFKPKLWILRCQSSS
jgi:hypothetical protein